MKSRNLIISAAVLVVIVAIIVVSNILSTKMPSETSLSFFPAFTEASCSSFLIVDKSDSIRVRRKGDVWVVAPRTSQAGQEQGIGSALDSLGEPPSASTGKEYPADSASVQSVLEKIAGLKREDLISENPEKQPLFEVDSASGIYVEAWNDKGTSVASFRLGKSGPAWGTTFVRRIGSDKVYCAGGSIRHAFFADSKRWRDKTIMRFPQEQAEKVTLAKKGGHTIELAKSTDTTGAAQWNLTAPDRAKAKSGTVDALVQAMAHFTCSEYEESDTLDDGAMGFDDPELSVTVVLADGATRQLTVGAAKGDTKKYWVRSEDRPGFTYLVSDYSIKKLDKNVAELKEEEHPDES
jgi:hypothetical protein